MGNRRQISSLLFEIDPTPGYHSAMIVIPVVESGRDWLEEAAE